MSNNLYLYLKESEYMLESIEIDTLESGITEGGMDKVRELIDGYVQAVRLFILDKKPVYALVDEELLLKGKEQKLLLNNGVHIGGSIVFCTETYYNDEVKFSGFDREEIGKVALEIRKNIKVLV